MPANVKPDSPEISVRSSPLANMLSPAERCEVWIAKLESTPAGLDALVKAFVRENPSTCPPFAGLGSRQAPSQAKWEKVSRSMVIANQNREEGSPLLYPRAMLEADFKPEIVRDFEHFAQAQGIELSPISSRAPANEEGLEP